MTTDMTWIYVADTAVKVGLGALLAGGFGALNAYQSHKKEDSKDYAAKRRELIESVMLNVDEFSKEVSLYLELLMNGVSNKNNGDLSQEDLKDIETTEKKVFEKFNEINSSKLKLLLISEKECHQKLSEYHEASSDFFKSSSIKNDSLTQSQLNEKKEKMQLTLNTFFNHLSEAYQKHA